MAEADSPGNERRSLPRHRVLKAGVIAFHGGGISCTVRNLTDVGAMLDVASPLGIPEDFTLVIDSDHFSRPCRIIWRKEKRIGIAFVQS